MHGFLCCINKADSSLIGIQTEMPPPANEIHDGQALGDVRVSIDVDKLNAYLVSHVPAVKAPVVVKQFKVGYRSCFMSTELNPSTQHLSMDK